MADWSDFAEELSEEEVPQQGIAKVATRKVVGTHDQTTRKTLALIILCLISLLYIGLIGAFILGKVTSDQLTDGIAAMSGPQALAAAAIGFYYGSKHG
ncbi:hypothetical protein [Arthrobacter crystallopoietes]|uniref:hypothetical protein n=1 Tax=Crystallibacter crystallopoietes TaxID=37928 RepID=UPI0011110CF6|nr:hypothetical protein [Arthrobacter crystallopoietes]